MLSELTVIIPIPGNTHGRDMNVTLSKTHLKVGLKSQSTHYIVNAFLVKIIIHNDSFWTVEDRNRVTINL